MPAPATSRNAGWPTGICWGAGAQPSDALCTLTSAFAEPGQVCAP